MPTARGAHFLTTWRPTRSSPRPTLGFPLPAKNSKAETTHPPPALSSSQARSPTRRPPPPAPSSPLLHLHLLPFPFVLRRELRVGGGERFSEAARCLRLCRPRPRVDRGGKRARLGRMPDLRISSASESSSWQALLGHTGGASPLARLGCGTVVPQNIESSSFRKLAPSAPHRSSAADSQETKAPSRRTGRDHFPLLSE
ncbi:hypothetical protein K438DRAFT_1986737 [Mycena galopus ATCC 62051]|nr:hypothetical protein K438DRAFT_1986737 [Mycena galopus ATCC 62051]